MCGICGFAGIKTEYLTKKSLEDMLEEINHRGPDEKGTYFKNDAAFGSQRLAIIDLLRGIQPIHNENQNIWVVFNGEIYNFEILKKDLLKKGHTFYTAGDTEVIVHLYEEYGENFASYLSGMFGLAIWDERTKKLILARDPLGVKPLYYTLKDRTIIFASEIKSLLKNRLVEVSLNYRKLWDFLSFRYIPGEQTLFSDIYKLMPGNILIFSDYRIKIKRFWEIPYQETYTRQTEEFYADNLYAMISDSIRGMLKSDVPVGIFLSGGLDSSIILSEAAKLNSKMQTFSVAFEKPQKAVDRREYNELENAGKVARYYNTEHYEYIIKPAEVIKDIYKIIWHLEEPLSDPTAIPLYYLSNLTRQKGIKAVLSGEGADEVFAGYTIYQEPKAVDRYKRLPELLRKRLIEPLVLSSPMAYGKDFIRRTKTPLSERYKGVGMTFRENEIHSLLNKDLLAKISPEEIDPYVVYVLKMTEQKDGVTKMLYFDQKLWLPEDVLTKADKISMAHSLEMRVPFLDRKLVEFAAGIPSDLKYKGNCEKYILRKAFQRTLPDFIYKRPKNQFPVPISVLIEGEYKDFVKDVLLSQKAVNRNYFNKSYINELLGRPHKKSLFNRQIWMLLIFELWHRMYLDKN
ncbi:MAG: asparagine synthase (glutamine-hydrolyzing) [Candidatus Omnitrophica bacterium]|nr:asparagine synthase (glutamine-hydrolyzing) [Candidatus Omnitrophota bacterium]